MDPHPLGIPFKPTDADKAWKESHEPTLAVKVWKLEEHTLISIQWSSDIEGVPLDQRPLLMMAGVALQAYERLAHQLSVLATVIAGKQAMEAPIGEDEVKH